MEEKHLVRRCFFFVLGEEVCLVQESYFILKVFLNSAMPINSIQMLNGINTITKTISVIISTLTKIKRKMVTIVA